MGLVQKANYFLLLFLVITTAVSFLLLKHELAKKENYQENKIVSTWWDVQSVDTVKYSRDLAREKLAEPDFIKTIDNQVRNIANIGATHVAIGTPYDDEFIPFLRLWVNVARKYGLNVWFRGNFSGWEGWFGYEPVNSDEHIEKTKSFILLNSGLFEDGDIFSSCPECENGNLGDPRYEVDVDTYREFLVKENNVTKDAFEKIGKDVASNYWSMNGDVAYLVMDKETTKSLDGIVVIDHYVEKSEKLSEDIKEIAERSGGRVVLGEFGAPIPDIHGFMNEDRQADWVKGALSEISQNENLSGVNYWTGFGGTTRLWNENDARGAADVIENYYSSLKLTVRVINELGRPIRNAEINAGIKKFEVVREGEVNILVVPSVKMIEIKAEGYKGRQLESEVMVGVKEVVLEKEKEGIIFRLQKLFVK